MARGSDVDENGNPTDPSQPPPTQGNGFYSLAYTLPDGTTIYQDAQGHYFTNTDMGPNGQTPRGQWKPYSGAVPNGPPSATPPGAPPAPSGTVNPPAKPPPTTNPNPGTGGGGAPGPGILDPFNEAFTPPARTPYPNAPTFTPPAFPTIPKWQAPSVDEALNDPGYQFRLSQGNQGLQNWAAARGTLNDSSTAKSLVDYNQNAGSQEYQNVWNRDFQGYNSDVNTQYLEPYQAAFQGWNTGTVAPGLAEWQTQMGATQHDNDMSYSNYFNKWLQDFNIFDAQRKFTDATKFKWATA